MVGRFSRVGQHVAVEVDVDGKHRAGIDGIVGSAILRDGGSGILEFRGLRVIGVTHKVGFAGVEGDHPFVVCRQVQYTRRDRVLRFVVGDNGVVAFL